MSSKFIVKKDLVEVEIDYLDLPNNDIVIVRDKTAIDNAEIKKQVKTAKAKFARPGWKNFNTYLKGCIVPDPNSETGRMLMDNTLLRDQKLRTLLRALEDGDGEKIILNSDFFDNIEPDFGVALIDAFDDKISNERLQSLRDSNLLLPEPVIEDSPDIASPIGEAKSEPVKPQEPEPPKTV